MNNQYSTVYTASYYEARILDDPKSPVQSSWTNLQDENDEDSSNIVRGDTYKECFDEANEVIKCNLDVPDEDLDTNEDYKDMLKSLVIARIEVTYYIPNIKETK